LALRPRDSEIFLPLIQDRDQNSLALRPRRDAWTTESETKPSRPCKTETAIKLFRSRSVWPDHHRRHHHPGQQQQQQQQAPPTTQPQTRGQHVAASASSLFARPVAAATGATSATAVAEKCASDVDAAAELSTPLLPYTSRCPPLRYCNDSK